MYIGDYFSQIPRIIHLFEFCLHISDIETGYIILEIDLEVGMYVDTINPHCIPHPKTITCSTVLFFCTGTEITIYSIRGRD